MNQNGRRGGRPSRFEPATNNSFPGQGILGEPPRQLQSNFGQNNNNLMSNLGPQQAKFGGPVSIPGAPGALPNPGMAGILGIGGPNNAPGPLQQIQELLRQTQNSTPMGNLLQQQQRSLQSSNSTPTPLSLMQLQMQMQQPQMPGQNTSIRDTQLNIVNNLLKGAMQGNGRMNNGSVNNNGQGKVQGIGTGNSIMGTPFLGTGGRNQVAGINGNFGGSGQALAASMGLPRPPTPSAGGMGQNRQIPSIFDIITSPTNGIMQQQQHQQRKRPGLKGQLQFEPDVKRYRQEGLPYPPGGSLTQTPRSRPEIRNSLLGNPRSDRSFSIGQSGRRDSSGSSHSERSQASRWQPFKGSSGGNKEEYDPAEPTDDQSRPDSVGSSSVTEVDGDFRVTVDNTGRSISDRKEEKPAPVAAKTSPHFCHTCNLECSNEQNFTEHMQSDFHKECLEGLLNLTQQKSSQLQARLKAEAHLRSIEGETSGNKPVYCKTCDESVMGSLVQHRRSTQHKMKERMNWPECSVCNQTFKSPQKLVRHMATSHHKDNRRGSLRDKEEGTVSDRSAENSDDDEAVSEPDESTSDVKSDCGDKQDTTSPRQHAAVKNQHPIGVQFVVPATGFFCQLCRKFYSSENTAKVNHCKSAQHHHNYQEWLASQPSDKAPDDREREKNSADPGHGENGTDTY